MLVSNQNVMLSVLIIPEEGSVGGMVLLQNLRGHVLHAVFGLSTFAKSFHLFSFS